MIGKSLNRWKQQSQRLQVRFVVAGLILLVIVLVANFWRVWEFHRVTVKLDEIVRDSQSILSLTTGLAHSLEREDDALLLYLAGDLQLAEEKLAVLRQQGDEDLAVLQRFFSNQQEDTANSSGTPAKAVGLTNFTRRFLDASLSRKNADTWVAELPESVAAYRAAGDALLRHPGDDPWGIYHQAVNPLLRHAVIQCDAVRELSFTLMQQAAFMAREATTKGMAWTLGLTIVYLLLGGLVAAWFSRSVLLPIKKLTAAVENMRAGNWEHRVQRTAPDELGELADAVSQLGESLSAYRQSSLGDLLASRLMLRSTLDALPDAVWILGPDGRFVDRNPPGTVLLEALGHPQAKRLQELELPSHLHQAVNAALSGKFIKPQTLEFQETLSVLMGGRRRRFMMTAIPIQGNVTTDRTSAVEPGAVLVFDDVTDFANLDDLRAELIGVASHELKSPLTTLRMALLMLGETRQALDERQQQLLDAANSGCDELEVTIEELLDVTRVESGQLRLNLEPVNLQSLLMKVSRSLHGRFEDAGVCYAAKSEIATPVVQGDAKRLASVFSNLLTNSLKYTPRGGKILVEMMHAPQPADTKHDGDENEKLCIWVTDNGTGIPEIYRQQVFEKFFRVEHTQWADRQSPKEHSTRHGTGIGLYLCREIIHAHGGTIRCDAPAAGPGTRIVIELPRCSTAADEQQEVARPSTF